MFDMISALMASRPLFTSHPDGSLSVTFSPDAVQHLAALVGVTPTQLAALYAEPDAPAAVAAVAEPVAEPVGETAPAIAVVGDTAPVIADAVALAATAPEPEPAAELPVVEMPASTVAPIAVPENALDLLAQAARDLEDADALLKRAQALQDAAGAEPIGETAPAIAVVGETAPAIAVVGDTAPVSAEAPAPDAPVDLAPPAQ